MPPLLSFDKLNAYAPSGAFCYLTGLQVSYLASLLPYTHNIFTERNDDTDALVDGTIDAIQGGGMIGTVIWSARETAPPGTLVCDGAYYFKDEYPQLYLVLADDLKDMLGFYTPNLIGRTLRGSANAGEMGGSDDVTLTVDQLPPHSHTYVPPVVNVDLEAPGVPDVAAAGIGPPVQTGLTGSGSPVDVTNAYTGLLPCLIAK